MKNIQKFSVTRTIAISIIAIVSILLISSCSRKVNFQTSSVVPAARGNVKISRDANKNYIIRLHLSDLAEVDRLQMAKESYVVWMVTDNEERKNIGLLNSSSGMLSSKLKANFETSSATKPTQIFITAEEDASVQYPGSRIILSTDRF
jgi:hypothetical protein